jgi:hypothetical protein
MKTYWGEAVWLHVFFAVAVNRGVWSENLPSLVNSFGITVVDYRARKFVIGAIRYYLIIFFVYLGCGSFIYVNPSLAVVLFVL